MGRHRATKVRVDAYVMVQPGGRMDGQLVRSCCGEIPDRRAASWLINDNGTISLFDMTINGFIPAPFSVIPNQWNKFSLIADTRTNNWEFAFNDVVFRRARPLKFLTTTSYIDAVNFRDRYSRHLHRCGHHHCHRPQVGRCQWRLAIERRRH